jgi:hypothetical protein
LPEKPAFNLPAGFFNKTWVFSSPARKRVSHFVYCLDKLFADKCLLKHTHTCVILIVQKA